jgi:hypothetical protein
MFPAVYNSAHQILQTPGYVVIVSEMIHSVRIVPLDRRPHVGANIRLWDGDSRGRWDGNTLVIDTTNYDGRGVIRNGEIQHIPQSEALHVVERFTRVDDNTMQYAVTIEDPHTFSRPWTVALPLNRDQKYQIYEYACHEGNSGYMRGVLRAGRVREKKAAGNAPANRPER